MDPLLQAIEFLEELPHEARRQLGELRRLDDRAQELANARQLLERGLLLPNGGGGGGGVATANRLKNLIREQRAIAEQRVQIAEHVHHVVQLCCDKTLEQTRSLRAELEAERTGAALNAERSLLVAISGGRHLPPALQHCVQPVMSQSPSTSATTTVPALQVKKNPVGRPRIHPLLTSRPSSHQHHHNTLPSSTSTSSSSSQQRNASLAQFAGVGGAEQQPIKRGPGRPPSIQKQLQRLQQEQNNRSTTFTPTSAQGRAENAGQTNGGAGSASAGQFDETLLYYSRTKLEQQQRQQAMDAERRRGDGGFIVPKSEPGVESVQEEDEDDLASLAGDEINELLGGLPSPSNDDLKLMENMPMFEPEANDDPVLRPSTSRRNSENDFERMAAVGSPKRARLDAHHHHHRNNHYDQRHVQYHQLQNNHHHHRNQNHGRRDSVSSATSQHQNNSNSQVAAAPGSLFASQRSMHGRQRKLTNRAAEKLSSANLRQQQKRKKNEGSMTSQQHRRNSYMAEGNDEEDDEDNDDDEDEDENGEDDDEELEDEGEEEEGAEYGNADGDGRDGNGEAQHQDDGPWCLCGEPSYDEMVACDNRRCPIEWFHFGCVGLREKPTGVWLCPRCSDAAPPVATAAATTKSG